MCQKDPRARLIQARNGGQRHMMTAYVRHTQKASTSKSSSFSSSSSSISFSLLACSTSSATKLTFSSSKVSLNFRKVIGSTPLMSFSDAPKLFRSISSISGVFRKKDSLC
uniref:Uncharacterized protein n=1 Tax=Romanomermis culicivorax TaxID=13658 RepID=A0A915JF37_ROMCU